jgi:translocation and assembly module TamB
MVQDITLDSRAGDWRLDAPFALAYTAGALMVAENCWTYLQTRLCMEGGKPAGQGIDAQLSLGALPLAWFNSAAAQGKPVLLEQLQDEFAANLPEGVSVEGTLNAGVTVRNLQGAAWDSLDVVLQPRALAVEITQQFFSDDPEAEPLRQRFGLDVNVGELHATNSSWAGALDLRVTHDEEGATTTQGTLRGSGELAADGTLSGGADLAFNDLGWLEFLAPELRDPAGMLNGTIGISGVRSRPVLTANLGLSEGSFDVPVYGLEIRNASLALATDANNRLRLTGSAQSGEGMLDLSADVTNPLQPTRAISAQVNGTNFLAFATDYATVHLSPQLTGSFADDVLTLNGSIEVANTEVDLEEVFGAGGSNAVRVSSDVVVVSGEQTVADSGQEALPISADLTVRVGENVHVSGYDLDANLSGELMLEQTPGRPILVYGELDIPEGRYEIYNQELNARDGRLVFFGNPANPLLDVRAFRETDTGEVGVLLTGNLDSIEGRLYSTPTLPDQEILALLVTGKSFGSVNQEESDALVGAIASFGLGRGEGLTQRVGSTLGLDSLTVGGGSTLEDSALGLGKYLTPDLLMRYKIGLFDRQSVLGIEYTLSERLKLEVESGISQSVDLNYTIEKD